MVINYVRFCDKVIKTSIVLADEMEANGLVANAYVANGFAGNETVTDDVFR